jgi:tetratricopeptide (TPR) repeat protein
MGHLWLQLLTQGPANGREILQESMMRHRLENDPSNASAHFNLGSLLLDRNEYEPAIPHFQDALRSAPNSRWR